MVLDYWFGEAPSGKLLRCKNGKFFLIQDIPAVWTAPCLNSGLFVADSRTEGWSEVRAVVSGCGPTWKQSARGNPERGSE